MTDPPDEALAEPSEDEVLVVWEEVVLDLAVVVGGAEVPPMGTVRPVAGFVPVPDDPPPPQAASSSAARMAARAPAVLRAACPLRITLQPSRAAEAGPSAGRNAGSR